MGSYKDQNWNNRVTKLGDEAEEQFEARWPTGFVRMGLNRPPIKLHKIPDWVRYIPDYLTHQAWVEVMGCGRDQIIKCKVRKFSALHYWDRDFPVKLFIWDSHNEQHHTFDLAEFDDCVDRGDAGLATFSEGKGYFEFPLENLRDWAS